MKKFFLVLVLFLISTVAYSQSIEIKAKKIDDIKAKLIDMQLQLGWSIENETTNLITFTKKNDDTLHTVFSAISNTFANSRQKFNFSQSSESVKVYGSEEFYSGKDVQKADTDIRKREMEDKLNKLKNLVEKK